MRAPIVFALAALLLVAPAAARATITIVNLDGAGEGFNDPTAAAPVGGNPGTTVGQQRLNCFNQAAQIWDAILGSSVAITIEAAFDPLFCNATSAVLGSAGPNIVDFNFPGAGFANTWYVSAEADRLAGTNLDPGFNDIGAQFNSSIGSAGCLTGRFWYYGFDGNEGNNIDLLPVLLHEFGHGLGFLTTTDETNGAYFSGLPMIFDRYLKDDVSNKHWFEMTAAERVASAINTTHLVWDGPGVTSAAPHVLGKRPHVVASGAVAGDFIAGEGLIGPALTEAGISGAVVLVNDGVGTTSDACQTPFTNAGALAGKVALLDRTSNCTMATQAANAQANGAIAVLIVNNIAGPAPPVRGLAPTVTIPVAALSQTDGNSIRTALGSGTVNVTIDLDPAFLAGATNAGQVKMYAPNPDEPGSSVSHFDVSAFPNLLMEPAINPDLTTNVDLTYNALFDIGWFPQLVSVERGSDGSLAFTHRPNPSRDGGTLRFRLPAEARVDLAIYDVAGRRIARLAQGTRSAGEYAVEWKRLDDAGHRVGPGVYLARFKAGAVERTLHIVLVE
jgi:hypothetical protein